MSRYYLKAIHSKGFYDKAELKITYTLYVMYVDVVYIVCVSKVRDLSCLALACILEMAFLIFDLFVIPLCGYSKEFLSLNAFECCVKLILVASTTDDTV